MINNIQFLRFVAASLVIFAHAPLNAFGVSSHAIHLGGFGVDIFFIISGFIIPYILFGASHDVSQLPKMGGVSFFVRRIVRIWPLYLVATIFVVLTALFVRYSGLTPNFEVNNVYGLAKLDWKMLFESLTFTHAVVAPTLNVGWTLQLEFLFYTAVAIILLLGAKSFFHVAFSYTLLLLGSALLLGSTGATFATYFPPVKLLATPMMIEFLFGLILYGCYLNGFF